MNEYMCIGKSRAWKKYFRNVDLFAPVLDVLFVEWLGCILNSAAQGVLQIICSPPPPPTSHFCVFCPLFKIFCAFSSSAMHIESYLNNALTGVPLPGQAPTANANAGGIAIDPSLLDDEDLPHPSAIGSSVNRRRRRSELGEDTDEVANYEQRLSRLLHFAEESMDRHNLEGESRNAVRKMAEVFSHL